jgi:hypothetical protein
MGTNTSLFDRVSGVIGRGAVLDPISATIEKDRSTTKRLSLEAAAVLIAGSARRLSSAGADVDRFLADADTALLAADGPIGPIDVSSGSRGLVRMLGDKWPVYVNRLADVNGLGAEQVKTVFNGVAPIVVAAVKERQEQGDLDRRQLAKALRLERDRVAALGLLSGAQRSAVLTAGLRRPVVHASRNVAKHRLPHDPVDYDSAADGARRRGPIWLWWSLSTLVAVLAVAWILSQTM